ncbi:WYL domain-containing protein [Campylobacter sp. RM15925]|uniref:WYL domain-containing protein n=1 Tax=Campylobacter sp. RM15925 TaxID=1705724 RepID=UPI001474B386|nr:WYL domain-containing protein [Campylobacter sp. RM15925]
MKNKKPNNTDVSEFKEEKSQMSSIRRILRILKDLNEGKPIYVENLKLDDLWKKSVQREYVFDKKSHNEIMSDRNIQRYFSLINEEFPGIYKRINSENGVCYVPNSAKGFIELSPHFITLMAMVYSLLSKNNTIFNTLDKDTKSLIFKEAKKLDECYKFITKPFESIRHEKIKNLEDAIKFRKKISLQYNLEKITVKPYKIIFIDENFYLACMKDDGNFSMLRISYIKDIRKLDQFNKDRSVESFIDKDIQTSFTSYQKAINFEYIDVKIRVDKDVAKYFTNNKKFLDSQNIEEELKDGSKIVCYRVTQFQEIKPFIKKWIPSIEVIEPIELRDEILRDIRTYQNKIGDV